MLIKIWNKNKNNTNDILEQLTYLVKLYFSEIDSEEVSDDDAIYYLKDLEEKLEKYSYLSMMVLEDNDKIVGFLLGNSNYRYDDRECGFILELFILNGFRKRGYGKLLVSEFEKLVDLDYVYLTSSEDARNFYANIGYETNNKVDEDNGKKIYFKKLSKIHEFSRNIL